MSSSSTHTQILSIAGYDPSHGAGLVRDALTCQVFQQACVSVCTANTIQTDTQFVSCAWAAEDQVLKQLNSILHEYPIQYCKIGIIENSNLLQNCLQTLRKSNPSMFILWDPIIRSSTGFQFIDTIDHKLLEMIDCITPNKSEYNYLKQLIPNDSLLQFKKDNSILIKSAAETDTYFINTLWTNGNSFDFNSKKYNSKLHGSGCRMASAILANLAHKKTLPQAVQAATRYLESQYRQAALTA